MDNMKSWDDLKAIVDHIDNMIVIRNIDEEYEKFKSSEIRRLKDKRDYLHLIFRLFLRRNKSIAKAIYFLKYGLNNMKEELFDSRPFWAEYLISIQPAMLNERGDNIALQQDAINDLKLNYKKYDKVYHLLSDDSSKLVFFNLVMYRITLDKSYVKKICSYEEEYFDNTIIHCNSDEIFVDCGGYNGDTALDFIKKYHNFKHIYIYEPDANNIRKIKSKLGNNNRISIREHAVCDINGGIFFDQGKGGESRITNSGTTEISSRRIDDDIEERVTFIKMDIEGAEQKAIIGCERHIKEDRPKLAISIYHKLDDLWRIAEIINEIQEGYDFYIRHYSESFIGTVLYAVPKRSKTYE